MEINRPILRYYGGKWKSAGEIIKHFPPHHVYVEPFGGAASVLIRKPQSPVEVYNDLNDEIVNLFEVLRDPVLNAELRELLTLTPYSRTEFHRCYELSEDKVEQARRTISLYSMSFNASKVANRAANTFRTNSTGHHRLPQSFQEHNHHLEEYINRLRSIIIENRDYKKVCISHDSPRTLIYLDPPYPINTRTDKLSNYKHEMLTMEEHFELFKFADSLKSMVVISSYDSPEYREWYSSKNWQMISFKAVTGASKTGSCLRDEVLWVNPLAQQNQRQLSIELES